MDNIVFMMLVLIVGLCLGSFYNVVILRSLSGESVVFPPSKCPKCGTRLKPWHNIPVLSYIMLRGKCAFCKEKISIQYPIVEAITGLIFVAVYMKFGLSHITLFALFYLSCLIIMTGTDIKEKMVDCRYAIAMIIVGVIYAFFVDGWSCVADSVIGAVLGFVIIELIARIGCLLKKGRAMGEADSYVAAALGAAVGYHDLCSVLIYALFASMFFVLPVFWYKRYKEKDVWTFFFSSLFIISIALNIFYRQALWSLILLIITGILLAYMVIKNLKTKTEMDYLPFVPALSAGMLYYIIFVL